jgi:ligand-binding sensor domain-containing protein/AraC-like DNA-binding protein
MKYIRQIPLCGVLILFFINSMLGQSELSERQQYVVQKWTTSSGLPHNKIQCILQTHDGYLWIGTPSGLVRFDGVRFTLFNRWNTPFLEQDDILCLYEDQDQALWIGTDGSGLLSYDKGVWKKYTKQQGLLNNHIRSITGDWQGNIWAGSDYGLIRLAGDKIQTYTVAAGLLDNIITSLEFDTRGNLWIGTLRGGLAWYNDGIFTVLGYKNGLTSPEVQAIKNDQRGTMWIGTMEGIFFIRYGEKTISRLLNTSHLPVTSIMEDRYGQLLIGTMTHGVKKISGSEINQLSALRELQDSYIRCIFKDDNANIWFGTDSDGLVCIKSRQVFNITKNDGLPENSISAILKDRSGTIWIGTQNMGVCRILKNGNIDIIDKRTGLQGNSINLLYQDKRGSLWIGMKNNGVCKWERGRISGFGIPGKKLTSNTVTAVLEDNQNTVWIGSENGLHKFHNGQILSLQKSSELANPHINVLIESNDHILYAGAMDGLYTIVNDSMIKCVNEDADVFNVVALYEDKKGVIWSGTNGSGLKHLHKGKFSSITKRDGLHDNYIFSISEDESNNLWMSSYNGVFRTNRKTISEFVNGDTRHISSVYYDESDGMASHQCSGEIQPAVLRLESGLLYYPTNEGVALIDPHVLTPNQKKPKVVIEQVICGRDSLYNISGQTYLMDDKRVEIRFTGLDFDAPQKIRFRYKLDNFDKTFHYVDPGADRQIVYNDLTSGQYSLVLQAANNGDTWSNESAVLKFKIVSPFLVNPILLLTVIITGLTVTSTLVYFRHKRRVQIQIEKYKTSRLDPQRAEKIIPQLRELMESEKLYLNPDLSLGELSKRLHIHYNHISRIINEHFDVSYNDYINKYRIEDVKQKLVDPVHRDKTVLEIMYETGFYSKSVFNTAFKKFTNTTPSDFRKNHRIDEQEEERI